MLLWSNIKLGFLRHADFVWKICRNQYNPSNSGNYFSQTRSIFIIKRLRLKILLACFSMFTIISLLPLLLVDFLDGSQLLLEFHSPVLEPDLDLSLSQTQGVSNLNATSASQVVVEVELLLQLQSLEPGVRLAPASSWTAVRTFDN